MSKGIKLVNSGIELLITEFIADNQPRVNVKNRSLDLSLHGTAQSRAPIYDQQIWVFTAVLEWNDLGTSDYDKLLNIYAYERSGVETVIHDYTTKIREIGTRTRALADSVSASTVDGVVTYHARFRGFMTEEPTYKLGGQVGTEYKIQIPITIQETSVILA